MWLKEPIIEEMIEAKLPEVFSAEKAASFLGLQKHLILKDIRKRKLKAVYSKTGWQINRQDFYEFLNEQDILNRF